MAKRAGGDDQIDRGHSDTSYPGTAGQIVCCLPYNFIDRELWERPCKLSQDLSFLMPASAVPKFELHRRAQTGLPRRQRDLDTSTNSWIATWAKHVYPRRCIDEDQGINPSGERLEVPVAKSGRDRYRNTV